MNEDKKQQLEKIMRLVDEYARLISETRSVDILTIHEHIDIAKEKYNEIEGRIIRISINEI